MTLPKEAHAYISNVNLRCEDLIEAGIWTGIDKLKLKNWLSNFKNDKEQYFIACILDSLIYRSSKQTVALIKHLFKYTLQQLSKNPTFPLILPDDWDIYLNKTKYSLSTIDSKILPSDPLIRFVVVIKSDDSPAKSAHHIARMIKKDLSIFEPLIITPHEIQNCLLNGVKVFIFVDDFLGTGMQFKECVDKGNIAPLLNSAFFAYVPLVAHEKGINFLKIHFPKLIISYVEFLDETYGIFNKSSTCFYDGENTPEIAKKFYYELLKSKKININSQVRKGYGELELMYVFEHASPDNSLPILWWPYTSDFKSLFNR